MDKLNLLAERKAVLFDVESDVKNKINEIINDLSNHLINFIIPPIIYMLYNLILFLHSLIIY